MKITGIKFEHFRAGEEEIALNGIDIFTGPNGSGKTRILQAVQLALSGAVPHSMGEKAIDTLELFNKNLPQDSFAVGLAFEGSDELLEVKRTYRMLKAKDGSISVTQKINLAPESAGSSLSDTERKLNEHVGSFPPMLDFREFLRLSDDRRAQMIFQFSPIPEGKYTKKEIETIFLKSLGKDVEAEDETKLQVVLDLVKQFSAGVHQGFISGEKFLKEKESELKKEVKESTASSMGSMQVSSTGGKQSLRHVEDIRKELDALRKDEKDLSGQVSQTKATKEAWDRLKAEKEKLTAQIKAETPDPELRKAMTVKLKNLQDGLEELKKTSGGFGVEDADAKITEANVEYEAAKVALTAEKSKFDNAVFRYAAVKKGRCPTCGQDSSSIIESAKEDHDLLLEQCELLNKDVINALKKVNETNLQMRAARDNAASFERMVKNQEIAIQDTQHKIDLMDAQGKGLGSLRTRLDQLNKTNIAGDMINLEEAETTLASLAQKITALDTELSAKVSYDSKIELVKKSALRAKLAEQKLLVVTALKVALKKMRTDIVREALMPIKEDASAIFSEYKEGSEFDFQFTDLRGNDVFKIGWMKNIAGGAHKAFIDFDSLSTAQQLMTIVSILSPLIARANPRLRILMLDNCEVVDEMSRPRFLKMIELAKEKHLDNIFIASSSPYPKTGLGNYHFLGDRS